MKLLSRLREVVPSQGLDYKLSKFETLQVASTYISALINLLENESEDFSLFNTN